MTHTRHTTHTNITYNLKEKEEDEDDEENGELENILKEFEELNMYENITSTMNEDAEMMEDIQLYQSYSNKHLMFICDFYEIKSKKMKKQELINAILLFEVNDENYDVVSRRKTNWFYIHELLNDKFMKKFILW